MPDPVQNLSRQWYDSFTQEGGLIVSPTEVTYLGDVAAYVMNNEVTGLTVDDEYIIRYDFTGGATVDADNPGTWVEWKYVRSDSGATRHTYMRYYDGFNEDDDPAFVEVTFTGGNDPDRVFLPAGMQVTDYCLAVIENADEETLHDKVPGDWTVDRTVTSSLGSTGPTQIQEFEFRMLAVRNFRVEKVQLDPNSEDHTAKFHGDIYALPSGWLPDGLCRWHVGFDDGAGNVFSPPAAWADFTPAALGGGKIGEISYDWDGRVNPEDEPVEGLYKAYGYAYTRTAYVGGYTVYISTDDTSDKIDVKVCGCRCKKCETSTTGNTFMTFDLMSGMLQSFVGPPLQCAVSYCSLKHDQDPASMGFGWSGPSTARVLEPAGQDGALVYRSESGSHLRWDLVEEEYVPATLDNYVKIEKTVDPDATYVLTFQDQSQREFDEDGLLRRTLDRNGLALTYEYEDGLLTSITDAADQVLIFDYGTREDGQPVSLSTSTRTTILDYTEDGRLEVITDPAGQTTTLVYNEDGLLWKIKDTRNEEAVVYEYDSSGRVISKQIYNQTLVNSFYEGSASFDEVQSTYGLSEVTFYAGSVYSPYACSRVVTVQEDLTESSPLQLSVSHFTKGGRLVCSDVMVEESLFNRTVMEYKDPHSPYLMTRLINPNLAETRWEYDADGNLKKVIDNEDNATEYFYAQEVDISLNPKHKNLLRLLVRPGSSLEQPSLELNYDTNGNLARVYDEKRNYTDYDVNSLGLVEAVTDRRGNTTTLGYDETSHRLLTITSPTDPNDSLSGRTVTLGYDDSGNVHSVTDDLENTVLYDFDEVDRITRLTDARGMEISMNYLDGLLDNVVAPANAGSCYPIQLLQRRAPLSGDPPERRLYLRV